MAKSLIRDLESQLRWLGQSRLVSHAGVYVGSFGADRPFGETDVQLHWSEHAQRARNPKLAQPTSVAFDLASLTKVLVTGPLVREACRRLRSEECFVSAWNGYFSHRLGIERPRELWPESLLNHRSGLSFWGHLGLRVGTRQLEGQGLQASWRALRHLLRSALCSIDKHPNSLYSDLNYLLLGDWLCFQDGTALDAQFARYQSRQLGLPTSQHLGYACAQKVSSLGAQGLERYAAPGPFDPGRKGFTTGQVHDENAHSLKTAAGHAGLVGTMPQVAAHLHAWLRSKDGQQRTVEFLGHLDSATGPSYVNGWKHWIGADDSLADKGMSGYHHLGFSGTGIWIFPRQKVFAVLLTNRIVSGRLSPTIRVWRQMVLKRIQSYVLEV